MLPHPRRRHPREGDPPGSPADVQRGWSRPGPGGRIRNRRKSPTDVQRWSRLRVWSSSAIDGELRYPLPLRGKASATRPIGFRPPGWGSLPDDSGSFPGNHARPVAGGRPDEAPDVSGAPGHRDIFPERSTVAGCRILAGGGHGACLTMPSPRRARPSRPPEPGLPRRGTGEASDTRCHVSIEGRVKDPPHHGEAMVRGPDTSRRPPEWPAVRLPRPNRPPGGAIANPVTMRRKVPLATARGNARAPTHPHRRSHPFPDPPAASRRSGRKARRHVPELRRFLSVADGRTNDGEA